ncbi:MAG TPA: hypothetical protein VFJ85_09690 [Acidimicrobiales bacterium]|nr:hypothetical protein [Acidimicrobiales bacterium]
MAGAELPDLPDGLRMASLAELYRRLARDQAAAVEFVVDRLEATLPGAVRVRRAGLFGRGPVEWAQVVVGDVAHELTVRHGAVETTTGKVVGGVVLAHQPAPLDGWVKSLLSALEAWAGTSDAARAALERLT